MTNEEKMTPEEAIARIKDHMVIHRIKEPRAIYITEALKMAIKALSQEPTRDIEKSNFSQEQYLLDTDTAYKIGYEQGKSEAQKSGKWTLMYEPKNMVVCSECGKCAYMYQDKTSAFCPHCGAKMQESEDKE